MAMHLQRREFLKASAAAAGVAMLPGAVRAASANGKLRTAHVGVGGMGGADLNSISSHPMVEVAALCDVDLARLNGAGDRHPNAKKFRDYREMIDSLGDTIDAVV
ncbi:MAG: twin-arginine translocation signal domain-containing protein, partial [Planctomycetales bacterium]|nr:twin-arginine translocation signal domain-containing protein [Planctomycetales bacterium]MCA9225695.1 twin-arginine translocation signal domain-containing protein [Planctomycetales bacterium]